MSDLDDELNFHREKRIAEFMATGATREEAERLARERLGDVRDLAAFCTRMDTRITLRRRLRQWASDLRLDLSHGLRQIRRTPATALAIVLTLGLGIGSTTATYAVVHKLLISPLPGLDADRIVRVSRTNKERSVSVTATPEIANAWRAGVPSLEDVAMYTTREVVVDFGSGKEGAEAGVMSANFPTLLGFAPTIGRGFIGDDTHAVLITDGVWRRRFGARRDVLGTPITIDDVGHTIVGILPRQFTVPFASSSPVDFWVPIVEHGPRIFPNVVARLRPGTEPEALQRELDAVLASASGQDAGRWGFSKVSRAQDDVGKTTSDSVLVLFGAVALVLLAGCANVANLLLARAQSRTREFTIRQSLGASRARLFRQLFTETGVLSLGGWALSMLVAVGCLELAKALRPSSLSILDSLGLEPRLIWVSLAVSVCTTLLFGLAPAALAAGRQLAGQLRRHAHSSTGDRRVGRWRGVLVVVEVALSVILLVGGGLLVRTLVEMQKAPVGFDPTSLVAASVVFNGNSPTFHHEAPRADRKAVMDRFLERVRRIPGVAEATLAMDVPPLSSVSVNVLEIEGRDSPSERTFLGINMVTPEYFRVTRTPILEGRTFDAADTFETKVMVSASMAKKHWPNESAVGKRLRLEAGMPWSTIVGVVADVTIPQPGAMAVTGRQTMYSALDSSTEQAALVIRGTNALAALFPALIAAAAEVDPLIRVKNIESIETAVATSQALPRFIAGVLVAFSAMSVLLAAIGLYGVIAHTVTRRWREMGIRRALGARTTEVLRPVLIEGAVVIVGGLVIGLAGAAVATSGLRGVLFQVAPIDVPTFAAAALVLTLVAVAAVYVPARRATRVDPALVLREE